MYTFDGNTYSLADMLSANEHDSEISDWLRSAEIGDRHYGMERVA